MRQKLEHQQLVTIEVAADKISWYRACKEIIIDGTLFDVATITYQNDVAIITGLYDFQEEKLDEILAEATGQNSTLNTILGKIMEFLCVEHQSGSYCIMAAIPAISTSFVDCSSYLLQSPYMQVPTPPPLVNAAASFTV